MITPRTLALNFTNEGGVAGTFRLLRNVTGLWLVQGIRRALERDGAAPDYAELTMHAESAVPFQAILDPDAPAFLRADDIPSAIRDFCTATGQAPPESPSGMVRVVLEGLALRSRWIIEQIEDLTHQRISTVHMVGGGSRNHVLCQMTADATGRLVVAGPVEATAAGNILVQLIAAGRIGSVREGRELIANSLPLQEYAPQDESRWQEAYERFCALAASPLST